MLALAAVLDVQAVSAQETAPNRAGLVIYPGYGQPQFLCVEFAEEQISGITLLERAGVSLVTGQYSEGLAVCKIDETGCGNPQNCFCNLQMFWSYWQLDNGAWRYSGRGSSSTDVTNGAVEGWAWTQVAPAGQEPAGSAGLPAVTFEQICPAATHTPTPTMTPTPTATDNPDAETATVTPTPTATGQTAATATFTPTPTFTPIPTSTPVPTATPTGTTTPFPVPVINQFTADRSVITFGEAATIYWDVAGAETVFLRMPGAEEVVPSQGNRVVNPGQTSSYSIVGVNQGGENGAALTIQVNPVFATPTAAAPTPLPTATQAPILVPPPTDTPAPPPTALPTNTPAPTDTPVPTATATLEPSPTPTATAQPDAVVIVPTTVPAEPPAPVESLTRPGQTREEQTRRLIMLGGLVLIAGLPLLFAGVWLILWILWKQ